MWHNNTHSTPTPYTGISKLSLAVSHRLRLQGFIWSDHNDILNEFNRFMSNWINEGRIKWKEFIYEGIENAPNAFVSLFKGKTFGRTLVKIGPDKSV